MSKRKSSIIIGLAWIIITIIAVLTTIDIDVEAYIETILACSAIVLILVLFTIYEIL